MVERRRGQPWWVTTIERLGISTVLLVLGIVYGWPHVERAIGNGMVAVAKLQTEQNRIDRDAQAVREEALVKVIAQSAEANKDVAAALNAQRDSTDKGLTSIKNSFTWLAGKNRCPPPADCVCLPCVACLPCDPCLRPKLVEGPDLRLKTAPVKQVPRSVRER